MNAPWLKLLLTVALCGATNVAWAQISRSRAAGAVAAIQAQRNAEAQRQAAVEAQIAQNQAQAQFAYPWSSPYGVTTYYRPVYPYGYGGYGYGSVPYAGYGGGIYLGGAYGSPYGYVPVGSIYAGSSATSFGSPLAKQPIGRREVQTGPNRWESYPIYSEEEIAAPPPAMSRRTGPREF